MIPFRFAPIALALLASACTRNLIVVLPPEERGPSDASAAFMDAGEPRPQREPEPADEDAGAVDERFDAGREPEPISEAPRGDWACYAKDDELRRFAYKTANQPDGTIMVTCIVDYPDLHGFVRELTYETVEAADVNGYGCDSPPWVFGYWTFAFATKDDGATHVELDCEPVDDDAG